MKHKDGILLPCDLYIFERIEDITEKNPPQVLVNWIATRKPVVRQSVKNARKLAAYMERIRNGSIRNSITNVKE